MAGKRHTPHEITRKLREAEAGIAAGMTVCQVCQKLGISEQTLYRWRNEYADHRSQSVERLKNLELENARLKRVVADQAVEILALKEVVELLNEGGNGQ
jgi:transposase-like protein